MVKKVEKGVSGVDFGTVNAISVPEVTIHHNLGAVPSRAVILPISISTYDLILQYVSRASYANSGSARSLIEFYSQSSVDTYNGIYNFTEKTVTFERKNTEYKYFYGTYLWAVFA